MLSKKRITRVRFNDSSRPANLHFSPSSSSRTPNQPVILPSSSRIANPSPTPTTTISPALSSGVSTPLTPSPQLPTFDNIVNKIFSKSLIAALTSKDAVLKEDRDCLLTNRGTRLIELYPYVHSYWRDLHVRSGCVFIGEKVALPNLLREALIEDIHASHPGTWGMMCMATHCWWPYMNRQLIVKATECKPCKAIGKNL